MSIDVNGIYGRWPVRTPGIWEPGEYLRKMDHFGIERALITATTALLDNTGVGNQIIAGVIAAFPDRFLGACVVDPNPSSQRAVSEAQRCLEQGFCALRLHPALHGYTVAEHELLDPLMAEAQRAGIPVILTLRVTGQSGFADTPVSSVRLLATRYPQVPIIVAGSGYAERLQLTRVAQACANVYLEISNMQGAAAVPMLAEAIGSQRLLLGTGMGVLCPAPAVRHVTTSGLPEADQEAILTGNAARLLKLP